MNPVYDVPGFSEANAHYENMHPDDEQRPEEEDDDEDDEDKEELDEEEEEEEEFDEDEGLALEDDELDDGFLGNAEDTDDEDN